MKIMDAVREVRSKNVGPLAMSIGLMFDDRATFERARRSNALAPAAVLEVPARPAANIAVLPYPLATAIKIVFPRTVVAVSPGDTNVYGAARRGGETEPT